MMGSDPTMTVADTAGAGELSTSSNDEMIREFVEHWGVMARSWGINATMGELFALLYVTGTDWTADGLRERLRISRGNVSMNLRELMAWGVVHKVHRQGERREFYRAESEVWTLFRRILAERKRRELDPTLALLKMTADRVADGNEPRPAHDRIVALQQFTDLVDRLSTLLLALEGDQVDALEELLKIAESSSKSE